MKFIKATWIDKSISFLYQRTLLALIYDRVRKILMKRIKLLFEKIDNI